MSEQDPNLQTTPAQFIHFHGQYLLIAKYEGIDYIQLKPLNDNILGLDWKGAKRTALTEDNADLYGTKWLTPPSFAGSGGLKPLQKTLYIRLDRADMYLAGVNITRLRANDNHKGADYLLSIKKEWAEVLHKFQTGETIIGKNRSSLLAELKRLADIRAKAPPAQRPAIEELMAETLAKLGKSVSKPKTDQKELPLT